MCASNGLRFYPNPTGGNYACILGIPKSTRCTPAEWQSLKKAIRWYDAVTLRIFGYGIVGTTTGGKCEIWTHGTFLFFGFQDRCIKPDSANFPCGIPSRTRTYRTLVLSQVCLPVSSWGYGAVGRIRTSEAISDRFTVCCLYPSWLQRHGSWEWIRTTNSLVNSQMLYHWTTQE